MRYQQQLQAYEDCMGSSRPYSSSSPRRFDVDGAQMVCGDRPPPLPETLNRPEARPFVATIAPQQLAFMAAAQLSLPDPVVKFEPDPNWNQWKKAFIGVNYWVWTETPTSLPTAHQTVGPASVRLTAKVKQLTLTDTFNGPTTCTNGGTPRPKDTELHEPSPTCAITFNDTGKTDITLTAKWAIEWTINGTTGTIELDRSASLPIEVAELHSVNR